MNKLIKILCLALPMAALAVTAPAQYGNDGLTSEPGVNREGGDYTSFRTDQLRECQRACSRDTRCRAYTYNSVDSRCYLKDRASRTNRDSRMVSGVKEGYGDDDYDRPGNLSEERGIDYRGGDYRRFRTGESRECRSECREDRRCVAYTYDYVDDLCYLKDGVGSRVRDSDKVSGTRERSSYGRPSSGGGLSEERGVDFRGGDYNRFRTRDAQDCRSQCRRDDRCAAYTYDFSDDMCYLKDRVIDRERDSDKVSGTKDRY